MGIPEHLVPILDEMHYELSSYRLEVCLIPGKNAEVAADGRMIRVACGTNVSWYRELCGLYPCTRGKKRSARKDYTKIKRKYIELVLERMVRNKSTESKYGEDLLAFAEDRFKVFQRLEEKTTFEPWNNQF